MAAVALEAETLAGEDPLVGARLGERYRVLWPVARGGMATFYEAEHLRLGRRVGLKVIHPHLRGRPALLQRFEREARAAARIESPAVVAVFDLLTLPDGRPAMITEWLEGEDLEARLARQGSLAFDEAIAIARDLCEALEAAHRAGVIHRDLKPGNVFLVRDARGRQRARLLDFGVAKLTDDESPPLTHAGSVLGTPAYMPPEQARGADDVDARADVYGVGALLYRLCVGVPPYPIGDPTATLARVLRDEPRRPSDLRPELPGALERLIQRAMARDRALRYASVEELDSALAALAALAGPTASEGAAPLASLPEPAGAAPGRGRATLAALGLGLAAGLAAAALARAELSGAPSASELRLIAGLALLCGLGVGAGFVRRLRGLWSSGPRVAVLRGALTGALGAGLAVYGGLALFALGRAALEGATIDAGASGHVAAGALCAAFVYWRRRPREEA